MKKDIQYILIPLIKDALVDLGIDKDFARDFYLDLPTDARFGDLSCNIAMRLSKEVKKSPRDLGLQIVEALRKHLDKAKLSDYIKEIKVEGAGFMNFYLADKDRKSVV